MEQVRHDKVLTLRLNGADIPLEVFVDSIQQFHLFIKNLSQTISPNEEVEWNIQDLGMGSVVTVIEGVGEPDTVERILEGASTTFDALESNQIIPYPVSVREPAIRLTQGINGRVRSIEVETPHRTFFIEKAILFEDETADKVISYGLLTGTMDTLKERGGLSFTLYDDIFDNAITCSVADESRRELMQGAWGKRVAVTGEIWRDAQTGHAKRITNITRIEILPDVPPESYKQARGILPYRGRSEDIIRSLRDDE